MTTKNKETEISLKTHIPLIGEEALTVEICKKKKGEPNRILTKLSDLVINELDYFVYENQLKLLDKFNKKRSKRGLEGKETPIPPKIALLILKNGFMEHNDSLQDLWINALLNWQDPEKKFSRHVMLLSVLTQLDPSDVSVLSKFRSNKTDSIQNWSRIDQEVLTSSLDLDFHQYYLSCQNLARLGLILNIPSPLLGVLIAHNNNDDAHSYNEQNYFSTISIMPIGVELLKAIED